MAQTLVCGPDERALGLFSSLLGDVFVWFTGSSLDVGHVRTLVERHPMRLSHEYVRYHHEDRTPGTPLAGRGPGSSSGMRSDPRLGGLHPWYTWSAAGLLRGSRATAAGRRGPALCQLTRDRKNQRPTVIKREAMNESTMTENKEDDRLEARSGFEPLNKGFADLCLTTWLPRH